MASKLSFDISLNSSEYVQGANKAVESNKKLGDTTKDYLNSFGPLKKQLRLAKNEAQNLAAAYSQLSKTEKESEIGKQMAQDLDMAIRKAGELQDTFNDVNEQIKNIASDTQNLDAFKEGLDLAKSVTVGLSAAMTELTGNEEEAARILKMLTTVTAGYDTAIKITTMLQANSKTMTALVNSGVITLTQATRIQTIATKSLGMAMKALPFIAIAAGAIALGKALYNYATAAETTEEKEARLAKEEEIRTKKLEEQKRIQESYTSTITSEYGKLMGAYSKLRNEWGNLSSEHQKQKWIKENTKNLKELGIEVNNVKDAENVFSGNSSKVIENFKKRAESAALAAQAVQLYSKSLEIELQASDRLNQIRKKEGDKASNEDFNSGRAVYDSRSGQYQFTKEGAAQHNKELFKTDNILKDLNNDYEKINNQINSITERQAKLSDSVKTYSDNVKGSSGGGGKGVEVNTPLKVNDKLLQNFNKEFEKKLQENLSKSKKDMMVKFNPHLDSDIKTNEVINKINSDLEKGLKGNKQLSLGEAIFGDSNFKNPFSDELDLIAEKLGELETKKIEFIKDGDTEGVEKLNEQIKNLSDNFNMLKEKGDTIADLSNGLRDAAGGVAMFGSAFTSLGQIFDSKGLQIAGIIAETIANLMLSFSEAMIQAAALGPFGWIAFGVQGLAQVAAMVAQIKSIASDAGNFAQGGVIGGSSYSGDKLIAHVNSGERILTQKQNKRLEEIANSVGGRGITNGGVVKVEGRISGKDLLLVEKNYNSYARKAGKEISIF